MKTMTLTKNKNRFFQGLDFLSYGLEVFAFIGFELLLYNALFTWLGLWLSSLRLLKLR